ncbi:hypothetical protein [Massilia endophytica]|uniref:hypothetical protein n=1 Tax=Massilia endophytica TaxID=2899220 RepID=UPI001E5A21C3|nr:hypothetical protein [Massilia endophytica]UGQ47599.1 hypothetical protein LSQ66_03705 [Massilia endophytica]
MKTLRQLSAQPKRFAVRLASIVMSILIVSFLPAAAHAAPPATVASCQGIKDAYPILGTQCETNYANINHAPGNAQERSATFGARKTVLQIFRKAVLCNGMYGASSSAQQSFKSGEPGHLTAIANVRTAMVNANDTNIPAPYTATDLNAITMTKQQCK